MIKGLYSAVSAMLVNSNRQQILSHDVANMDTPGFKQILSTVEEFSTTRALNPMGSLYEGCDSSELGLLGLGVQSGLDTVDFTQGGIQTTDNPYDLAIQGTGFFHVKTPEGDRYTRDGRFNRDASGMLVTTEGYQVLGKDGQPIQLTEGDLVINSSGGISVGGVNTAQLDLVEFENPSTDLQHDQGNLFMASGTGKAAVNSSIMQSALEASNVSAAQVMSQMIEIARAYEAAQQMVQNQDELLGKAISSLGSLG